MKTKTLPEGHSERKLKMTKMTKSLEWASDPQKQEGAANV